MSRCSYDERTCLNFEPKEQQWYDEIDVGNMRATVSMAFLIECKNDNIIWNTSVGEPWNRQAYCTNYDPRIGPVAFKGPELLE